MKRAIRTLIRKFGFDIIKFKQDQMGIYPFYDMAKFVDSNNPVLFDIGANIGQTVKDFKEVFDSCSIQAFEPSAESFEILKQNTSSYKNLNLWNLGVGSSIGELILNEYVHSNTNSFLDIHENDNSNLKKKTKVEITTVDFFCEKNNIEKIDVLKIDTEGFELEVFKGCEKMFSNSKIGLLFFEVRFVEGHHDMPSFTELWNWALDKDFELVSIYPIVHRKKMGIYTNVLFKHKSY
ncbi:FkbM family methyltransferase [Psychroserpens sp. Hel_I_66]|uniref:FkbM family methyltransferase n=1 Tax=Psychroserpens sp. Hel_I_66 TaxID=1250004 RepID=UPI0006460DBC|nr:FkbM family methyltransferase [Psychroserpens sp. Hel_I_66]